MTWIICQTLFCQNVEIENSPNFNDVDIRYSPLTVCFEVDSNALGPGA